MRGEEGAKEERTFEGGHRGRGGRRGHHAGAKTFRRGRAIEFLGRMHVRRESLKRQLETPELQSVNPVLVGELKAVEMVIDEFAQLFEIQAEELNREETDQAKHQINNNKEENK